MSYGPEMAIALLMLIPLAAAVLIPIVGRSPNLREGVTFVAGLLLLANVIYLCGLVAGGARPELLIGSFAGMFEIKFRMEPLGAIFAAIASSLWIVNSMFTLGYMRGNSEKNQTRFFTFVAIAIASAMGIAASANLITLFIFYEALTISTFPLVSHKGDAKARRGLTIYTLILMGTSLGLLLPAIIGTQVIAGTTDFVLGGVFPADVSMLASSTLLVLFAFGIGKAALMPVHPWLPNAMVAPTPVSALLHAVAVVKAGVFTMLKVVVYTFGTDLTHLTPSSSWLAWIAAFSIVAASVIALRQDNLKARLAYSTVSQLSYITLGAMLATSWGIMGGGLQIVMHAWGKITLFMVAGAIYTIAHRTNVSQLDGLGRKLPWVFGAFLVASVSLIGIPPFGGSWPKFYLMWGALDSGKAVLMAALIISSLLNILYLMPIAIRGFMKPPADPAADDIIAIEARKHRWVIIPPVITAIGTCVLFFAAPWIIQFLEPII
ncbi:cation:proton antiporter [Algimonas ampicilliniresistens]|uniref:Cation:proton antiporter n=1 Tax=Algimonas ampicilliniresistens TaxID=1298735 RepID=A0ABQ5V8X6_9PROT|nr:proton-conducting transporter membrane subunit [Algimonas ampicilliniresistens]GLQ22747.1 cation:proton antiporter [Algimonas ampicilliniresistens]